jgi:hypothetical protein
MIPTVEAVRAAVLEKRSKGWQVLCMQEVQVPKTLPYADGGCAWEVALMKRFNELGEEPAWLQGCDQEMHLMYYEQMGEMAKTQTTLEVDLVIFWQDQFYVYQTRAGTATTEEGGVAVTFLVQFPGSLDEEITPA